MIIREYLPLINLSIAAKKLGIHRQTLWKYVKEGKIKAIRQPNNRLYFLQEEIDKFNGIAIYSRVSSSENKDNLESQTNRLVLFANARGWKVVRIEIGSGVNDHIPKLLALLKDAHKYEYIIVEHKDRLTRFVFNCNYYIILCEIIWFKA